MSTPSSFLPAPAKTVPYRVVSPAAATPVVRPVPTAARGRWRVKVLGRPGTLPEALRQRLAPGLDVVTEGDAEVIVLRQADCHAVLMTRAADPDVPLIAEPPTGIEADAVVDMLDAGADCVVVDTTTAELVARIHAALRRCGWGPARPPL